uniref:DIRP domain-containing protein n=1 Tax=Romanomermis culicivorax TaxID=13658 RepID=A0A915HJZ7_ROMCU
MTESLRRTAELLLSFKNSAKSSEVYFPSTSSASCSDSSAGRQSIHAKKRLFLPATSNSKHQQSQSSTNTSPSTSAATSNTESETSDDEDNKCKSNDRRTSGDDRNFNQPKTSPSLHQYFPPNLPYEAEQFRRELYNKYGNPSVQLPGALRDSLRQLKNLLKLPKARRFVWSEFFYSDVDRELFLSDNDFRLCLRESFPALKARQMTKVEWQHIRRSIGKPRRCSQAFFDEERHILLQKRQRIRDIYKGTALSLEADLELPSKIPHPFVVGSRVVARIRLPKDGIFVGTVDAVMDGKYRIFFDKDILPPLVVDDSDLKSVDWSFNNLAPVSFFIEKNKAAQPLTFRLFILSYDL